MGPHGAPGRSITESEVKDLCAAVLRGSVFCLTINEYLYINIRNVKTRFGVLEQMAELSVTFQGPPGPPGKSRPGRPGTPGIQGPPGIKLTCDEEKTSILTSS